MSTPTPPGLVGGGLFDYTDGPAQPATPSLVGSQQPQAWSIPGVPPPPELDSLATPIDGAPILFAYGITSDYKTFGGRAFSPLAGPATNGDTVAFWGIHAPFTVKRVSFVCQAVGGKPPIPSSDTGSANEVLLDKNVVIGTPTPLPAGDELCTVVGSYLYVLQQAVCDTDSYGTSKHPMSNYPAVLNTLNPQDFTSLLGPAQVAKFNGVAITF